MADTKNEAKALISELPVAEEVKQKLLAKLEAEGVSVDFIVELKMAVVDARIELNATNKEQLDKLEVLDKQEEAGMAVAHSEFNKEMDELEEDADNLDKAVTKALEEDQMEEARGKIASQ